VIQEEWPLIQVADELEIHTDTVRDRLECYGLRHPTQAARFI
jgi:hypothetical protein